MNHPVINLDAVINLVKDTRQYFSNREMASHITEKGVADYVTETDMKVQTCLCDGLKELYPDIQFMGEERDNSDIDFSGMFWILDPVDGTTNLIHQFNHSAVSLALACDGEVLAGIIYCPYTDELFSAYKNEGAFLNGVPIHVSDIACLRDSLISVGTTPYEREHAEHVFDTIRRVFLQCQDIRRTGSAAMDLANVACGRTEAYFEMNLKPWDFAAGLLLVEEAGGRVATFSGAPVLLNRPCNIVASNEKIADELFIYLSAK